MVAQIQRQAGLMALLSLISCIQAQENKTKMPSFRVDVSTVFLNVTVADRSNRYVTGFEKKDFTIYEDNVQQTISHFSQHSGPVSLGYIFDISGSMGFSSNIKIGRDWFRRMLAIKDTVPGDECFLITFNDKINLDPNIEYESTLLTDDVFARKPGGWTALYDAVYAGINKVLQGKNDKKALIIISDGEENRSAVKWSEVRELAQESNVLIYAIGLLGPQNNSVLKQIAEITGGRIFYPSFIDLRRIVDIIHAELRSQYTLGYVPTKKALDGKWRTITVKLNVPPGFTKLSLRTRRGYYAAKP